MSIDDRIEEVLRKATSPMGLEPIVHAIDPSTCPLPMVGPGKRNAHTMPVIDALMRLMKAGKVSKTFANGRTTYEFRIAKDED